MSFRRPGACEPRAVLGPARHDGRREEHVRAGLRPPEHLGGDAAVMWIASRQHGVVTVLQLLMCGLTRSAIEHRVRRGRLFRLHRGVYAVGRADVPSEGRVLAAVLAGGPSTVASHWSAAMLHAFRPPGSPATRGLAPADVTAIGRRLPRHRHGVRCHETRRLDGRDLRWVGPVPTTSAARTVVDIAGTEGARPAERLLAHALRSRLTTEEEVRSLLTRSHGHHGAGIVARLVDTGPAFDRSLAERLLLELVRRSGLPEPLMNVRAGGFEVDALWVDLDVVVEFDSLTFHGDVLAFRRDRRKSRRLQAAGYDVVPVVWSDLQDAPEVVVADISAVLALARLRNR